MICPCGNTLGFYLSFSRSDPHLMSTGWRWLSLCCWLCLRENTVCFWISIQNPKLQPGRCSAVFLQCYIVLQYAAYLTLLLKKYKCHIVDTEMMVLDNIASCSFTLPPAFSLSSEWSDWPGPVTCTLKTLPKSRSSCPQQTLCHERNS